MEALTLFSEALTGKHGRPSKQEEKSDNVTLLQKQDRGNSKSCTLFLDALKHQGQRADLKQDNFVDNVNEVKRSAGNSKAYTLSRDAMLKPEGRQKEGATGNNITSKQRVTGTSKAYTLSRLSKQAPDLYQQVVAGELSAQRSPHSQRMVGHGRQSKVII